MPWDGYRTCSITIKIKRSSKDEAYNISCQIRLVHPLDKFALVRIPKQVK